MQGTETGENRIKLSPDEFIDKLRNALKKDGDFPASARIVAELRRLVGDPKTTANQITEIILREPSLGTRILHIVNSSFYRRAKPIMTVSQAVIQIGMKPLADLCAGLVLLQRFVPAARRDGAFANCLKRTIVTSLLSSSIGSELAKGKKSKSDECGFLAGSFAELGLLLLAFYFPQLYETAIKRAEYKHQDIGQSIADLTGLNPTQISIEVLDALHLPEFYKKILQSSIAAEGNGAQPQGVALPTEREEVERLGKALGAAKNISEVVTSNKGKPELDRLLDGLITNTGLDAKVLNGLVGDLPAAFKDHCTSIELALPALPQFITTYASSSANAEDSNAPVFQEDQFSQFVNEIRSSVENREPTASIITTVMETFAWGLKFDRVLLLLMAAGRTKLVGRMLLGNSKEIDPKKITRMVGQGVPVENLDATCAREARPIFTGNPILEGGWPIVAIPIGLNDRCIGVIYADRISRPADLDPEEQAAIQTLCELLDRSVVLHS